MTGLPLSKACDLVAAIGCLPITLDVDAMSELGVSPHNPVSLQLTSTTVGQVLQAIAEKHRLVPSVEAGQVLVTSPAEYRETLRRVRYTVSDVTGDGATPTGELAGIVRRLVAPESWQVNGGRGGVDPTAPHLVVIQSGDVHQQVLDFCEKLRLARHKPLRSRGDHERFSLSTHPAGPQAPDPGGDGQLPRVDAAEADRGGLGRRGASRDLDRPHCPGGCADVGSGARLAGGARKAARRGPRRTVAAVGPGGASRQRPHLASYHAEKRSTNTWNWSSMRWTVG